MHSATNRIDLPQPPCIPPLDFQKFHVIVLSLHTRECPFATNHKMVMNNSSILHNPLLRKTPFVNRHGSSQTELWQQILQTIPKIPSKTKTKRHKAPPSNKKRSNFKQIRKPSTKVSIDFAIVFFARPSLGQDGLVGSRRGVKNKLAADRLALGDPSDYRLAFLLFSPSRSAWLRRALFWWGRILIARPPSAQDGA